MGSLAQDIFQPVPYSPSIDLDAPYPANTTFPLALTPSDPSTPLDTLTSEIYRLSTNGTIRTLLNKHGAIYFKNLSLPDAASFSAFAHAFNWTPHEDIGNPVRRTLLAPNVATANEGPRTQPIYPHNEFGLSSHYPTRVLFYCLAAPTSGGQTPINSSTVLYRRLRALHPATMSQLEARGLKYQITYADAPRTQTASPASSVLQAYGAHVLDSDSVAVARAKVEREIRRLPTATWEWLGRGADDGDDADCADGAVLGDLRVWQVLPAVRRHVHTGQLSFFNNAISRFLNALAAGSLEAPWRDAQGEYRPPAFYGDGGEIPRGFFESAVEVVRETRVLVGWEAGEVLLLDNLAVQHGREVWEGERRLLASLWDGD